MFIMINKFGAKIAILIVFCKKDAKKRRKNQAFCEL